VVVLAGVLLCGCAGPDAEHSSSGKPGQVDRPCDDPGLRSVVEQFGRRLKQVPLTAPDSLLEAQIRSAYGPFVTPMLLDLWLDDPSRAPGREVSSPWPERIEVRSTSAEGQGVCRVEGEVVYLTSVEQTRGGAALRAPIVLRVESGDGWRIRSIEIMRSSD
jgi:hypothetical protein